MRMKRRTKEPFRVTSHDNTPISLWFSFLSFIPASDLVVDSLPHFCNVRSYDIIALEAGKAFKCCPIMDN